MISAQNSERILVGALFKVRSMFPAHAGDEPIVLAEIEGLSFDSLYKQLCSSTQLKLVSGEQGIAPFAFVSMLAGTLLLFEIIRHECGIDKNQLSNE